MLLELLLAPAPAVKPSRILRIWVLNSKPFRSTRRVSRWKLPLSAWHRSPATAALRQNQPRAPKLARVLWIPVEGDRAIPLAERRVGSPLLWQPNAQEEQQLREDWEELMDMIVLGVERITARHGAWLQIRPKAANSKALTEAIGEHGEPIDAAARFYPQEELYRTAAGTAFSAVIPGTTSPLQDRFRQRRLRRV